MSPTGDRRCPAKIGAATLGNQTNRWKCGGRLLTALGSNGQIIIDVIPEVELIIGSRLYPKLEQQKHRIASISRFRGLSGILCKRASPGDLLDDLQWIDAATLKLIELILLDEQTHLSFF